MPPADPTTLRGALLVLGPERPAPSIHGWFGDEVPAAVHGAVRRAVDRLGSQRGIERHDTVIALHTALVVVAFFGTAREVLSSPVASAEHPEDRSFVAHLYSDAVPAPSVARDLDVHLSRVGRWVADRAERVYRVVNRTSPCQGSAALLGREFAHEVVSRYRADYLVHAVGVREFRLWESVSGDTLATREELELPEQNRPPDSLTVVHHANRAAQDVPVSSVANAPAFKDVYVAQTCRIAEAGPLVRLADVGWWSAEAGLRDDLDWLVLAHLTGAGAHKAPLLVTGGPGSGKSTLGRMLASRLPHDDFVVVRTSLAQVDLDEPLLRHVDHALLDLTEEQISWNDLADRSSGRHSVLVLDDLDLARSAAGGPEGYLDEVIRFQQREARRGHRVAVVVMARTSFVDQLLVPHEMPVVQLAGFDERQTRAWIDAWNAAPPRGRRPLTLEAVRSRPDLTATPLLMTMFALHVTDPFVPESRQPLSVADLYRSVERRRDDHGNAELGLAAIASLGAFNRRLRSIPKSLLFSDLAALGHQVDAAVVEHFVRVKLPAAFADHEVAEFLLEELRRRPLLDDDRLFALLSHRPLAPQPGTLTFLTELAGQLGAGKLHELDLLLDDLLRRFRDRPASDWFTDYRPTPPDAVRSLAAYSANLILLRLFTRPPEDTVLISHDLVGNVADLWTAGLDASDARAMTSLIEHDPEGLVRRRAHEPPADPAPRGVEFVHRGLSAGAEAVGQVGWSADGGMLTANAGGRVTCWAIDGSPAPGIVGDVAGVSDVAWHPQRPTAAVVQRKKNAHGRADLATHHVALTGFEAGTTRVLCAVEPGTRIEWSPDGELLALFDREGLWTVDAATSEQREVFKFGRTSSNKQPRLLKPRWSEDCTHVCAADARFLYRFQTATRRLTTYPHSGADTLDFFAPHDTGGMVAVVSRGGTDVEIHTLDSDSAPVVLEGHTKRVLSGRFSPGGDYFVSMAGDNTVQLWRCSDWQRITVLVRERIHRRGGLAFHPDKPLLAVKDGSGVDVVRLEPGMLDRVRASPASRRYSNAKIVLVGDSGVGKSGLGLVLSGQPFVPTESTHGRNVWTFDKSHATTESGEVQTRETLLWDLAGQPGYRMVHQLHLNEVAVALVVFDARSETDPFAGVRYWSRALAQARRLDGPAAVRLRVYLVAARTDRGTSAVSRARIDQTIHALGFDGYLETSAKEGWGVDELISTVRSAIDWDAVPTVSSTALFQEIKDFLLDEKSQGRVLATADDLLHTFRRIRRDETLPEDLADGFAACLGRLEGVGLVRRMEFGGYVLLRTELLDSYASSLVQAARHEPDGLGFVPEADALAGRFRMPESDRLTNPEQERVLLNTVVQELLGREVALKEHTDREVDLIFPSQFTRERPDAPDTPGQDVVFTFDGHLHTVYATLAVRLSHSRFFKRNEMWHNSATFEADAGGTCGIAVREIEEGKGELVLFFDDRVQPIVRRQFEVYVVEHLEQRAGNVVLRRIRRCKPCDQPIDEVVVQRRLSAGFTTVRCQLCDEFIPLVDSEQPDVRPAVAEMNSHANARRDLDVAATTLQGKREAEDYDVFLCHNVKDKPLVLKIVAELEARGILPWLDIRDIQPGSRWQNAMADGIAKSRSAAVLIGPSGFGPWHDAEMHLINDWSVRDTRRRVIPVILDGTEGDITLPGFLRVWSTVDMRVADPDPVEQFVWGITGEQPNWS